jgi:hypothetical protein
MPEVVADHPEVLREVLDGTGSTLLFGAELRQARSGRPPGSTSALPADVGGVVAATFSGLLVRWGCR